MYDLGTTSEIHQTAARGPPTATEYGRPRTSRIAHAQRGAHEGGGFPARSVSQAADSPNSCVVSTMIFSITSVEVALPISNVLALLTTVTSSTCQAAAFRR